MNSSESIHTVATQEVTIASGSAAPEHALSPVDIGLNVGVQVFNIALFFFLFIRFAGGAIATALDAKIAKEKRLADADKEYAAMMADAQAQKDVLVSEGLAHKKHLMTEAVDAAKLEREKLLSKATAEAESIVDKATKDASIKQRDMDAHFVSGVKQTAMAVIQKIFASKKDVQTDYLTTLVDEFSSSYSPATHA